MMGERTVMQEALFYGFSLEQHVPVDHMLRSIDRFVNLSEVRKHLEPFYSSTGRPSVDPELMIRMLIVGYCSVSDPNCGCATRFISTSPIAGFVAWVWRAACQTTRPSRGKGTADFATAISCVGCPRRLYCAA